MFAPSLRLRLAACLILLTIRAPAHGQQTPAIILPAHLTAEEDHQRVMNLLHITALRRGPDGDPKSPNAANFDESKVGSYTLPDPIRLNDGKKVKNARTWWKQRRPQIVEDFDREIYGRVPANTPDVPWEVTSTTREMSGSVPVITKELVGHVDNSRYPLVKVDIHLTLSTPANAKCAVPVIMEFSLSPEVRAALAKRFPQLESTGPTWEQQVAAKGWGYASLIATTVQADDGDGLTEGIIGLVNKGQPRKLDDWGTLRAGPGERAGLWITSKQIKPLTSGKSELKGSRAMAKQLSSPWPTIAGLRSLS